ncbi:MAG TPA: hypothetical protein VM142_15865 [Acidimicrobiales bacterium]|nr:hypothetical protein [Acidimicrobiales bacterium]
MLEKAEQYNASVEDDELHGQLVQYPAPDAERVIRVDFCAQRSLVLADITFLVQHPHLHAAVQSIHDGWVRLAGENGERRTREHQQLRLHFTQEPIVSSLGVDGAPDDAYLRQGNRRRVGERLCEGDTDALRPGLHAQQLLLVKGAQSVQEFVATRGGPCGRPLAGESVGEAPGGELFEKLVDVGSRDLAGSGQIDARGRAELQQRKHCKRLISGQSQGLEFSAEGLHGLAWHAQTCPPPTRLRRAGSPPPW